MQEYSANKIGKKMWMQEDVEYEFIDCSLSDDIIALAAAVAARNVSSSQFSNNI